MARPLSAFTPPDPMEEFDSDEFFANDFLSDAGEADEEIGSNLDLTALQSESAPLRLGRQALRLLGARG